MVSNVINGLVGTHIPLGIIPSGTANLLAQELKVPLSIKDAIALIIFLIRVVLLTVS